MDKNVIDNIVKYTKDLKVLFIEDDFNSRVQTLKMLENFFLTVVTAVDGLDALQKFEKQEFDIIFSDINMPKLNGIEFIKQVRNKNNHIPIVMISAYDNSPYLLSCIEIGIEGYLIKPIEIGQFLKVLQKIVDKVYDIVENANNIILLEGDYCWNKSTKKLSKDGEISLTSNESKFLDFLICSKGMVRSYMEIDLYLYQDEQFNERKIRNLVSRLRKKIGTEFLESFYAQGYRVKLV